MKYKIEYEREVLFFLERLNVDQRKLIIAWIEKNLIKNKSSSVNPKTFEKLQSSYLKYRVGNYRLLCEINDLEIKIIAIKEALIS